MFLQIHTPAKDMSMDQEVFTVGFRGTIHTKNITRLLAQNVHARAMGIGQMLLEVGVKVIVVGTTSARSALSKVS